MLEKIDIRDIVRDHYGTLVDFGTGHRRGSDYVLFLGVPVAVAVACDIAGLGIDGAADTVVITAVAILAGLLFNVLVLVHAVANRFVAPTGDANGARFLREIYSNIAYAILVCLTTLAPLAFLAMSSMKWLTHVVDVLGIFLVLHLLLTLLMVLKRLHALLRLEIGASKRT